MSLEYAPLGLVGMLTPQANTTVEPEFNLLWPPGVAMINARLMSDKPGMSDRLVDYFATYAQSLRQFANAPIGVAAAACTGASYLAGREREAKLVAEIEQQHGFAFLTAALAVVDAFRVLGARRIGLVSPYPDDLNQASVAYWQSHGLEVAAVASAYDASNKSFHPIYSMAGSAAEHAARSLQSDPARRHRHARDRHADLAPDRRPARLGRSAGDVVQPVPRLARGRGPAPARTRCGNAAAVAAW